MKIRGCLAKPTFTARFRASELSRQLRPLASLDFNLERNFPHFRTDTGDAGNNAAERRRVRQAEEPRYSRIPSRRNLLTSAHTYVSHQHAYNIRVINV